MAAQQTSIRFRLEEQTLIVQVAGRATMYQCLPMRRFLEKSLCQGIRIVGVDLRHCIYFDSTFLGTFLYLLRCAARRDEGKFVIISPSPQCASLFCQMGVRELFEIQETEEFGADGWKALTQEAVDQYEFEGHVIQAHEELAKLSGKSGEQFRAVMRCLAKDIEKRRQV